ncbi:Glu-tRNA(Gln) amidotransferase subunit GatE [Candidatus Micrarchaeota archaeon]|nr:Glu-tRNA(Gln) amidotransferase subunit GatE [Candidatus Micrarchaeota archaeon]
MTDKFKCGLEIHQRLDTHKLFCSCSSNENRDVGLRIHRRQYAVKSELGETDIAARYEEMKENEYVYDIYDNCCLVETDGEPPHDVNPEAVEIVIGIAKMLHAKPIDEAYVMRKTVIDGSNTSGFQRTMVIATDGYVETSKGRVRIESICLEEESAGIVKRDIGRAEYRLDRLGIPLVEITTAPDIIDPDHAVETAGKIGRMLRMTKVLRGIGTIRQDVNVSIPKGARVEIKGFQDIREMKKVILNEIERQKRYNEIIEELKKRFNGKIEYPFEAYDITNIFENTKSKLFSNVKKGWKVMALKMPNFEGIFGSELLSGYRYGTELSDYAKPAGVNGIIHSDENIEKYHLEEDIIDQLNITLDFPYVMVVAPEDVCLNALHRVYERSLLSSVPAETRKVSSLTTRYFRPLPGSARMYPETDIPPVKIHNLWDKVNPPEDYDDRLSKLEKMLGKELASKIVVHPKYYLFEKFGMSDPKTVAWVITDLTRSLSRSNVIVSDELLEQLFKAYSDGLLVRAAFEDVLKYAVENNVDVRTAVEQLNIKRIRDKELEKIVRELKNIKDIMRKYRLQVDPKDVQEILKNEKMKK